MAKIIAPHSFYQSSEYEKSWHPIADKFYLSKYPKAELKRYNKNTDEDLIFQKRDIDISIKLEDRTIHISEKFRKKDYGDFLIELYSKYPEKKGWMNDNNADVIAYFNSEHVYFINKNEFLQWFENENFYEKLDREIKMLNSLNNQCSTKKELEYISQNNHKYQIALIQAFNQTESKIWHTISISIKWDDLKLEGIEIKEYTLA